MKSTLKPLTTTVALGLVVVFASFANVAPASAAGDCVKVAGKYFADGKLVPNCSAPKAHKLSDGVKHQANHPRCVGKKAGHQFLDAAPNGRLARFTCT
jgi:hypothetical protein